MRFKDGTVETDFLEMSLVGGVVAGIAAYLSIAFLTRYFRATEVKMMRPFAIYCARGRRRRAGLVDRSLIAVDRCLDYSLDDIAATPPTPSGWCCAGRSTPDRLKTRSCPSPMGAPTGYLGAARLDRRAARWPFFANGPEALDGLPDPLDRWSARIVGGLAQIVRRAFRSSRSVLRRASISSAAAAGPSPCIPRRSAC